LLGNVFILSDTAHFRNNFHTLPRVGWVPVPIRVRLGRRIQEVRLAETEVGGMSGQCLDRRRDGPALIAHDIAWWQSQGRDRVKTASRS
jgi:hypothetical protein